MHHNNIVTCILRAHHHSTPGVPNYSIKKSATRSRVSLPRFTASWACKISLYPAELIYFNFHPLEIVSRYRDPQL